MFDKSRDCILFSINTRLDSWDMENIKYIKKITIRDSETFSYVSDNNDNSPGSFVLTSATLPYDCAHPPPASCKVLDENVSLLIRPPEQTYMMDVLVVANESVPRQTLSKSISLSSNDSCFSSGSYKTDNDGDKNRMISIISTDSHKFVPPPKTVKKSVSFLEQSRGQNDNTVIQKVNRSASLRISAISSCPTGSVPLTIPSRIPLGPALVSVISVPYNGKLLNSEEFQAGYANNWTHLEHYIQRLKAKGRD